MKTCKKSRIFSWIPTSDLQLEEAEQRMLDIEGVSTKLQSRFVEISDDNFIRTIKVCSTNNTHRVPLVLLHGFGAAVGFWSLNLNGLSQNQDVYAIDLLGFGRSSRPTFPRDVDECEQMFVRSIEEWAVNMHLDQFILLGHSFGGYLATVYAMTYPTRIAHLILPDPWGFPAKQQLEEYISGWRMTLIKAMASFNPLSIIRIAGPCGPSLVRKARRDISLRFERLYGEGDDRILNYLFHCNARQPSGETAFMTLSSLAFANKPLTDRMQDIHSALPITILYGSDSWMINFYDFDTVKEKRPLSCVNVHEILDASHHLYADQVHVFNQHVERVCQQHHAQ